MSTDTTDADTLLTEATAPIREESEHHAGLASIEAEFAISDADSALLDLSSLAFDQVSSPLSAAETKMAVHRSGLDDFMDRLNAAWSERTKTNVDLQPYFMIPECCWEGDHLEVLVEVLGLTPAQTWNVVPLAGNTATGNTIGVAVLPGAKSIDVRPLATTLITEAVGKMHAAFEQATFAGDTVDTAALERARAQATGDIMTIARRMATAMLGAEAFDHAKATFFGN